MTSRNHLRWGQLLAKRSHGVRGIPGLRIETWSTRLAPRVPPPIFLAQNPCFLELTGRVALQNIENKEVPCKIFQDKELRAVLASFG